MKNVILLFADDMRYGMIDNPEVHTPNLCKLAANGIKFTNAHIPGGTSGAVCMPSRAMLHTGRLLEGLKNAGRSIPKEHILLGETLRENGYETHGIGKWHNGPDSYARSFSSGAEIFFGGMEDHWNVPANNYDPTGRYNQTIIKSTNAYLNNNTATYRCDHITPGKHSSELFAESSVDFLKNHSKDDKPFFLYTSFMAPHDPRTMPLEFLKMYNIKDIELPENYMPMHPFDFGVSTIRDEILAPYPREKNEIKRHLREYYAMVSHLDACIGKILDSVNKNGLTDDTIIIFAADNGLAVGSHGLMGKQNLYEHSIRVPLIINGPGIPKDTVSDSPVFIADLFPTILDMLNIVQPKTCTAESFSNNINGGISPRDVLKFRYKNSVAAIKRDGFKLIKYILKDEIRLSLFNLKDDPYETRDIIDYPEFKNLTEALLLEINEDWQELETS
ncbi:MAG: sulfatase-like hydrolase/transferase [Clostridiales bacterium]|nr:sulfatase-like hydrolase/transferase [Clostridiales bacterium]